jgi:hypothetical protein
MTTDGVEAEIGALAELGLHQLRDRRREVYGSEPPRHMSPELLLRAVAYRIQENRLGGLSPATRAKLLSYSSNNGERGSSRACVEHTIKAGTRFVREWNNRTHEVTATGDGAFSYAGGTYRSLSAIAREITGTRWSGPAFFGLKAPAKKGEV